MTRTRSLPISCLISLVFLLGFGPVFLWAAPPIPTTLMGTVVDASNNSLPAQDSFVMFDALLEGNTIAAYTDSSGFYIFENFPLTPLSPTHTIHSFAATKTGYAFFFDLLPSFVENTTNTINVSLYVGGRVSGIVKNAKTSEPIPNVRVEATWPGISALAMSVTGTASDGTYTLEHIYPGYKDIKVTHADYAALYKRNVWIEDQQLLSEINFSMRAGGTLSGIISDNIGNPLNEVSIKAVPNNGDENYIYETMTNTAGAYSLPGMLATEYSLRVMPLVRDPHTFRNFQTVESSSVHILAGQTLVRNYILQPGGYVAGRLTQSDGSPVENIYVVVYPDEKYPFEAYFFGMTDADGRYTIGGLSPQKNYTCMAYPLNNTVYAIAVQKHMSAEEMRTFIWDVTLGLGGGRQGEVTNSAGQPVILGQVMAINDQLGLPVDLTPTAAGYSLLNLPAGDYHLSVFPKDANLQGVYSAIHVTTGMSEPYSVQLQPGGILEGTVTNAQDGSSLVGVKVSAKDPKHPLAGSPDLQYTDFTDENGHYTLRGFGTGDYTLEFIPEAVRTDGFSPYSLRTISVIAGQTHQQNIALEPGGIYVSGSVRDQNSNRVMYAIIRFWSDTDPTHNQTTSTNQWGTYALMLKAGRYRAQAYYLNLLGSNLAGQLREIDVSESFYTHDFVMQTGAILRGKIHSASGAPVHLALVRAYSEASGLPALTTLSNENGEYALAGLASDRYTLDIQAAGFSPFTTPAPVVTTLGNQYFDMNYSLVAVASIGGQVRKNQKPLPKAQIQVISATNETVMQCTTLENGNYSAEPLLGGPFTVKASALGLKTQTISNLFPGNRADFDLTAFIGKDEAISCPNPCRGNNLSFKFWLEESCTYLIRVYNQAGELVWDLENASSGGRYVNEVWDVSGVAPGVYLYKVTTRNEQGSRQAFPVGRLTILK